MEEHCTPWLPARTDNVIVATAISQLSEVNVFNVYFFILPGMFLTSIQQTILPGGAKTCLSGQERDLVITPNTVDVVR